MSQYRVNILIVLLSTLLLFVIFFNQIVMINGPGTASVVFRPFLGGVDTKHVYGEGVYFVCPWNTTYQFNVREQLVDETLNILVKDGVNVGVRVNYRYYPIQDSLGVIFKRYGARYDSVFVKPEVLYAVRQKMSGVNPIDIYSRELDSLKVETYKSTLRNLKEGNVSVSDVLIVDIKLPRNVVEAIENKSRQQQLDQSYDFEIQIAEKKKRIKMIEAQGEKYAQDTISRGLTQEYLQFRQIDALQKLSTSPNAKTIVMPNGSKTPILLNQQ